jgi:hypothetical protein
VNADPQGPDGVSDVSQCHAMGAALVNVPNGEYDPGSTRVSIDIGFPFRYAFTPEIAIVALQTLIAVNVNGGVSKDHTIYDPATKTNMAVGAKGKPDFVPSIGIATNPIPQLSLVLFAQLRIPDFDTTAGAFQIPATLRAEASPTQRYDIGLDFSLLNLKPPEGQSPTDNLYMSLFMQARY